VYLMTSGWALTVRRHIDLQRVCVQACLPR